MMSKEKFTEGKWVYTHNESFGVCSDSTLDHCITGKAKDFATGGKLDIIIARINVSDSEDIANAHLMAVAPDMYREIQSVIIELQEVIEDYPIGCPDWVLLNSKIERKEKLLSEARGE